MLSVIELMPKLYNLRSRTLSRSRRREPSPPVDYPSDDTADTEPDVRMAEVGHYRVVSTEYLQYLPSIYCLQYLLSAAGPGHDGPAAAEGLSAELQQEDQRDAELPGLRPLLTR